MLETDACLTIRDALQEVVCVVIRSGSIGEVAMIGGVELDGIGVGLDGFGVVFGSKSCVAFLFPIFG